MSGKKEREGGGALWYNGVHTDPTLCRGRHGNDFISTGAGDREEWRRKEEKERKEREREKKEKKRKKKERREEKRKKTGRPRGGVEKITVPRAEGGRELGMTGERGARSGG